MGLPAATVREPFRQKFQREKAGRARDNPAAEQGRRQFTELRDTRQAQVGTDEAA